MSTICLKDQKIVCKWRMIEFKYYFILGEKKSYDFKYGFMSGYCNRLK